MFDLIFCCKNRRRQKRSEQLSAQAAKNQVTINSNPEDGQDGKAVSNGAFDPDLDAISTTQF